jgi:hypothetical protein
MLANVGVDFSGRLLVAAVVDHDPSAGSGKTGGDSRADAATGTGHQGHFVG